MRNLGCCIILFLGLFFGFSANVFSVENNQTVAPVVQQTQVQKMKQKNAAFLAEEKRYQSLRKESKKTSDLMSPSKVFANLIVVIFILLGLAWLYNKYGKDAIEKVIAVKKDETNTIKILSTSVLGQGKNLHVVEVDGERLLIGATSSSISFLKDLHKKEKAVSDEQNNSNW